MRIKNHPILHFTHGNTVTFTFEGKQMEGYSGEPIAAALAAAGIKVLSYSRKLRRPRGFFCAIGNCLLSYEGEWHSECPNLRY